jgi:hypothetical protein
METNEILENMLVAIETTPDFTLRDLEYNILIPSESVYEISKKRSPHVGQNMGATILDCILQSGVNYERTVKPRITDFRAKFPHIKTTSDFYNLILASSVENLINWKGAKIQRIKDLTMLLIKEHIETEDQLNTWLKNDTNILKLLRVKGIKHKTVDYLKILAGDENSIAMDIHLHNFIKTYGDPEYIIDYSYGKEILTELANRLKVQPAQLDHSIWYFMAHRKKISEL